MTAFDIEQQNYVIKIEELTSKLNGLTQEITVARDTITDHALTIYQLKEENTEYAKRVAEAEGLWRDSEEDLRASKGGAEKLTEELRERERTLRETTENSERTLGKLGKYQQAMKTVQDEVKALHSVKREQSELISNFIQQTNQEILGFSENIRISSENNTKMILAKDMQIRELKTIIKSLSDELIYKKETVNTLTAKLSMDHNHHQKVLFENEKLRDRLVYQEEKHRELLESIEKEVKKKAKGLFHNKSLLSDPRDKSFNYFP